MGAGSEIAITSGLECSKTMVEKKGIGGKKGRRGKEGFLECACDRQISKFP